jgi:hypothetical protein
MTDSDIESNKEVSITVKTSSFINSPDKVAHRNTSDIMNPNKPMAIIKEMRSPT